jgi:hypothetical protein
MLMLATHEHNHALTWLAAYCFELAALCNIIHVGINADNDLLL